MSNRSFRTCGALALAGAACVSQPVRATNINLDPSHNSDLVSQTHNFDGLAQALNTPIDTIPGAYSSPVSVVGQTITHTGSLTDTRYRTDLTATYSQAFRPVTELASFLYFIPTQDLHYELSGQGTYSGGRESVYFGWDLDEPGGAGSLASASPTFYSATALNTPLVPTIGSLSGTLLAGHQYVFGYEVQNFWAGSGDPSIITGTYQGYFQLDLTPTPTPATGALLAAAGMCGIVRRRRCA